MGRAYSQDLRDRILGAVDGGVGAYPASALFRVSVSYIYKALARRRTTGETTARASKGRPGQKLAPHHEALLKRVEEVPDTTLEELRAWLRVERDVTVSIGCLWTTLDRLGVRLKKSFSARPNRTVPTSQRRGPSGASVNPS